MTQNATDSEAKITAAMFAQLLDKLTEKGVLEKRDVEEIMIAATKSLEETSTNKAFGT
ncbi:hypothetical protein [Methylobacterium fujisawaense]|uniref:hypothetical protein n=1 Tax=Methylobacterium fujisawaense TaxID=107400 RepID=UPI00313D0EA9